jgi:hypothetical protein
LSDAVCSTDNTKQKKASVAASLRLIHAADFFQEIAFFRKQAGLRPALSDILKERDLLEDVCVLSSLTDLDIDAVLFDVCRLFRDVKKGGEKGEET